MIDSETTQKALLAELDLHKTEFSALREEILQRIESQRQYLNLNLIAIAASLGIAPFILEQGVFIAFLLYPVVFHVLLWEMLLSVRMIGRIVDYLTSSLIPRVNTILDDMGNDQRAVTVLGWEIHNKTRVMKRTDWLFASISPTQHWVPIISIAAFLIAYIFIVRGYRYSPPLGEIILLGVNLAFLVLAALFNVSFLRDAIRGTGELDAKLDRSEQLSTSPEENKDPKKVRVDSMQ